jgi:hypothetical protein
MGAEKAQGLFADAAKYETFIYIKPVDAQPVDIVETQPSGDTQPKLVKAVSQTKPPVKTAPQLNAPPKKTPTKNTTDKETESLFQEFRSWRQSQAHQPTTRQEKESLFKEFQASQQNQRR